VEVALRVAAAAALAAEDGRRGVRRGARREGPGDQDLADAAGQRQRPVARKVLGWPKRCKLAHAFLWEYS
jgi:hypothetical protein